MNGADLLDLVQPADGWYAIIGVKDKTPRQKLVETREEADKLVQAYVDAGRDVYFGVAKYASDDGRKKENVKALKAFWLDIDCGPDKAEVDPATGRPDGYENQSEGLAALKNFCKVVGLPRPTLVDSGRGLHVYWPLTEEISRAEWEVVADRFREVCRTQEFYVDDKVFEVARVLRVPGTYNFKDEEPNPVKLLSVSEPVSLEEFREILGVVEKPKEHREWQSSERDEAISKSIGYSFKKIMQKTAKGEGCNQLAYAYENRGSLSYYEWFYALSVAAMCEDAEDATQRLSEGHPEYDAAEVARKVATIKKSTSCAKFRSTNPELCEGCPNLDKIFGPRDLGRVVKRAPEGGKIVVGADEDNPFEDVTGEEGEHQAPKSYDIPVFPKPFFRAKSGGVWVAAPKDSEEEDTMVYEHDLFVTRLMDDGGTNVVVFRLHLPHGLIKEFTLPLSDITAADTLRKGLANKGVVCTNEKLFLSLKTYVLLSVKELQHKEKELIMRQQFGWADNYSRFILGDKEISATGITYTPPSSATKHIAKHMHTKGSLEKWKEVWALYGKPGTEPVSFAALTGFGSLLLTFLNQTGAVLNLYNPSSGTGKSTVLHMVNSIFGHPKELRLQANDTENGRYQWVGALQNIPPTMDELTNMTPKEYSKFLYALSNGKGKERMVAGANELRENNTTWCSATLATSNASFAEKLAIEKRDPQGELMRLIEYPLHKMGDLNTIHAKHMFDRVLFDNYGHAAIVFVQYVMQNLDAVTSLCDKIQRKIDSELELDSKERFWSGFGASNISAGYICKHLGLIDWDMEAIYKFFCKLIDELRENTAAPADDVKQVVADYLYRHMQNILVVDGNNDLRTGKQAFPQREPKGDLLIRIEPDTKRMYVLASSFREYCVKYQISYGETVKKLETQKVIFEKKNVRLSRGTNIPGGSIHCLWFDISEDFVDADKYAETEDAD